MGKQTRNALSTTAPKAVTTPIVKGLLSPWAYDYCSAYAVLAGKDKTGEELAACVTGGVVDVTTLPASLKDYFAKDVDSYSHEILFNTHGEDPNPVRSHVIALANGTPSQRRDAAKKLAFHLAEQTDARSNPGLLVILVGRRAKTTRVALWKLPKGEAFQTLRSGGILRLRQIESFASKTSKIFKGAAFEGTNSTTAFWEGRAEDNQVDKDDLAQYWIHDFLDTQHKLTDGRFNLNIARGLQEAIAKAPTVDARQALLAVPQVLRNRAGQTVTMAQVVHMLPAPARAKFTEVVGLPTNLMDENHELEADVFEKRFRTRIVEINDDFTLRGPDETFNDVVEQQDAGRGRTRFTLTGTVTNLKLKNK